MIKEADGVISDYSSMVWDFAYQRKPVILFQFDQKSYERHWGGFFDKTIWKFGPVVTKLPDLVKEILQFGQDDAKISEKYRHNMDEQLGKLTDINKNHYLFIDSKLKNTKVKKLESLSYKTLNRYYIVQHVKKINELFHVKIRMIKAKKF